MCAGEIDISPDVNRRAFGLLDLTESPWRGYWVAAVAITDCANEWVPNHASAVTAMTEVTKGVNGHITTDTSINSGSLILRSLCKVHSGTTLAMSATEGANGIDCTMQTLMGVSPFLDAIAVGTKTRLLLAGKVIEAVSSAFDVGISLFNATSAWGAASVGLVWAAGIAEEAHALATMHGLIKVAVAATVEACSDSDETVTWHLSLTLNRRGTSDEHNNSCGEFHSPFSLTMSLSYENSF